MANLTLTPASVIPGANAAFETVTWGATIAAGDVVYLDTADGKCKLADANGATAIIRKVRGIAITSGGDGQKGIIVISDDDLTLGSGLFAIGDTLILSATPGKICPDADAATGDYKTVLGIATTTGKINFRPFAVTVAKA